MNSMNSIIYVNCTCARVLKNITQLPDKSIQWLKNNNLKFEVNEIIYEKVIRISISYSDTNFTIDIGNNNNLCINSLTNDRVLKYNSSPDNILLKMPRNKKISCSQLIKSEKYMNDTLLTQEKYDYILSTGVLQQDLIYWRIVFSFYTVIKNVDGFKNLCKLLHFT